MDRVAVCLSSYHNISLQLYSF